MILTGIYCCTVGYIFHIFKILAEIWMKHFSLKMVWSKFCIKWDGMIKEFYSFVSDGLYNSCQFNLCNTFCSTEPTVWWTLQCCSIQDRFVSPLLDVNHTCCISVSNKISLKDKRLWLFWQIKVKSLKSVEKLGLKRSQTLSVYITIFFHSWRLKCQMSLGSNEGQVGHYDRGQRSVSIKSRAEICPHHRRQLWQ